MKLRGIYYLLLFSIFNINISTAQENNFYSSSNISLMLEKLDVFGKVLYIAAHPDDENTRLIQVYVKNFPSNSMEYRDMTAVYFDYDEE